MSLHVHTKLLENRRLYSTSITIEFAS